MEDYILPLPTTRKLAKELGCKYFYNGNICLRGHNSKRKIGCGTCYECKLLNTREHRKNNSERVKAKDAEKRRTNKVNIKKAQQKHYWNNQEKFKQLRADYAKNFPEEKKAASKNWADNNPDKVAATASKRRAQQVDATPLFVAKKYKQTESAEQKAEFKDIRKLMRDQIASIHAEAQRLTKETGIKHSVDHIWPVVPKEGDPRGLHVPWNLQILPQTENASKSNKLPNDPFGYHIHPLNPNRVEPDPNQRMIQD